MARIDIDTIRKEVGDVEFLERFTDLANYVIDNMGYEYIEDIIKQPQETEWAKNNKKSTHQRF